MRRDVLIYGANGYTGALTARLAVEQGLRPLLAGRSASVVELASTLGLDHRIFGLDDAAALDQGLAGVAVVIHCAGPFSRTSRPMVDACLRNGVHYLDITGEIEVFEAIAARDAEARARGVMLLPGAGFDVVPSDCLAAHLARRVPEATELTLAFSGIGGGVSHGTATTMVENMHRGGVVRRGGRLVPVPSGSLSRDIDYGRGPRLSMAIPWGDVSTAYRSTGIPNIVVYTAVTRAMLLGARAFARVPAVLSSKPVQRLLKWQVDRRPAGPTDEQRRTAFSVLWGEVKGPRGARAISRMRTPEGYTLTALTSLLIAKRVLAGDLTPGAMTPSLAYGPDLILEVDGVVREDLVPPSNG